MKNYNRDLVKAISGYLEKKGWKYLFHEEWGTFTLYVDLNMAVRTVNYTIFVAEDRFIVNAVLPIGVDKRDQRKCQTMSNLIQELICNDLCQAQIGQKGACEKISVNS